jgi:hypothetical protein
MAKTTNDKWLYDFIFDDRSVLLLCQRERICRLRREVGLSYNTLAKMFNISKYQAYCVVNPEYADKRSKELTEKHKTEEKNEEENRLRVAMSRDKKRYLLKRFTGSKDEG